MSTRNEDFLFAQEALNLGYVSEEQVDEGFLLQKRMANDLKIDERLAVILVKRGWMAEEQARRVYGIVEPEGARTEIEGYRLVQKIGRGAMGTVYKAIHKNLHRVVAIKILRRDLAADKTQIERLKREAKLLADLDHPNIVRAFDAGESNGFPFLVMEYVEGETLRDRIAREGPLSNDEALRITRALADALEKARRMGVVHRDVKPGNILLSKSGTPKLMDLGLAKGPIDAGLTQHGATVGTPQFMSPEQAESPDKADIRSDIYSLGATLYAMMTGRPPFEGSTLAEIIMKVMSRQPVPPRVRNEDVSPEVSHLIERMMLKDASLRYTTPAQVVADIDLIRGGQSIIPQGFQGNWEAYLLRKRWRERRKLVIGSAAAVLLLGFGLSLFLGHLRDKGLQADVDGRAETILRLEVPTSGATDAQVHDRLNTAVQEFAAIEEIADRDGIRYARIEDVLDRKALLERAARMLNEFRAKEKHWKVQAASGSFNESWKYIEVFGDTLRDKKTNETIEPAHARWAEYRSAFLALSERAWVVAQDEVENRSAADVGAFVSKWRAYYAALLGPYVETEPLKAARRSAEHVHGAAVNVGSAVADLHAAFASDVIGPRVEAFDFYPLRKDWLEARDLAQRRVEAELPIFRKNGVVLEPGALLGESGGVVTAVFEKLKQGIDDAVLDRWERIKREIKTLAPEAAVDLLTRFADAAARGDVYKPLADEAEALRDAINDDIVRRRRESQEAYRRILGDVVESLRKGDRKAMETAIEDALKRGVIDRSMETEVERLRVALDTLRAVQEAAVAHLGSGSGLAGLKIPVRAGDEGWTEFRRVKTLEVLDKERFRIKVTPAGRTRPEWVVIHISEVRLDAVLGWAQKSGRPLPPLAAPLFKLARLDEVKDEPGKDLRPLLASYRAVLEAFEVEGADPDGAWTALARGLVKQLDDFQQNREIQARVVVNLFRGALNREVPKYKEAIQLAEELSDPEGYLRYTDVYDEHRAMIEQKVARANQSLHEQELLTLFHGDVGVKDLGGERHRITYDFDDPEQMANFERGLGVLEPTVGPITPMARGYRLHLLKGVQGLLFDRPLSLDNPFDTNRKISVEFTIDTRRGRGSSILAVDIDGVQIAVCSLDPNYWRWRFPAGTPTLSGEDGLPEFDYYGRGRGIAFHDGPDFGRSFPLGSWTWSALSDGSNFEKWKDRSYLEKHRKELFAFAPGQRYTVRVERERDVLRLIVDGGLVVERRDPAWMTRGKHQEKNGLRNGSGAIQILTLTPLTIDNLELEGEVTQRWISTRTKIRDDLRAEREAEERKKKEAEEKKKVDRK